LGSGFFIGVKWDLETYPNSREENLCFVKMIISGSRLSLLRGVGKMTLLGGGNGGRSFC
jgi:hypothetical protein